jgi:hypothetical protein
MSTHALFLNFYLEKKLKYAFEYFLLEMSILKKKFNKTGRPAEYKFSNSIHRICLF